MMVIYDYDSTYIHVEPMKSRAQHDFLSAYTNSTKLFTSKGLKPKLQRMDNETTEFLQQYMTDNDIQFQLTPPHVHRRNAAERAIRTFKNHFIAGLASTDPNFPLSLWDKLIPQAVLTLNLLRASRLNPSLSAHSQLHGTYDYNKNPIAPPGTKVMVHVKPSVRQSWAPHAVPGWYLGTAFNHYRCHRVWLPSTRAERVCDTVTWFPTHVTMPVTSKADHISAILTDLLNATTQPHTGFQFNDDHRAVFRQLADCFPTSSTTPGADNQEPTGAHDYTEPLPRVDDPVSLPPTQIPRVDPGLAQQQLTRRSQRTKTPIQRFAPMTAATLTDSNQPLHASIGMVQDPESGLHFSYSQLLKGSDAPKWIHATALEIGRLAQGYGTHVEGTNTLFFISHLCLPKGRIPTYLRIVAEEKPNKTNPQRVRFTAGGDRVSYPGPTSTPTADLTTAKLLFNSVISTCDARFGTFDIKNFYLNNPMARYEYMWIPLKCIPQCIIDQYNLLPLVHNGKVLVEIRKGMYGLPQAGIIAHTRLVTHLALHGYKQAIHTPGLFQHITRPISFTLVVDDFGIKYVGKQHAQHLLDVLRQLYEVTTDWSGTTYCGLTLNWNYKAGYVDISMPGYVARALKRFQHPVICKPQYAPALWQPPSYGTGQQNTPPPDTSMPLSAPEHLQLQQIVGVFLYYARAVDSTMLVALNSLAAAPTTKQTAQAATHLLNYAATNPSATVRFRSSEMILHVHSDASYLSAPKARSRTGGFFYLSEKLNHDSKTLLNGAVYTPCTLLKVVVASATEAELGALFFNLKDAVPLRNTLAEMGHPQPPTPVQTDNACAAGILNSTVKQRRSKAIDMRFYWVRDRIRQQQFKVYWVKGSENLADYFTKNHAPAHHKRMRSTYLLPPINLCPTGQGVLMPQYPRYTTSQFNPVRQEEVLHSLDKSINLLTNLMQNGTSTVQPK
jgi:hypothetical protein